MESYEKREMRVIQRLGKGRLFVHVASQHSLTLFPHQKNGDKYIYFIELCEGSFFHQIFFEHLLSIG